MTHEKELGMAIGRLEFGFVLEKSMTICILSWVGLNLIIVRVESS